MDPTLYFAFILAVIILVLTPGPSVLLGVSHSLGYGWRRVLFTALGDVCANVIQMALAATGLGLILATSATAFSALKIIGILYLVWLGIKTIRSKTTFQTGAVKHLPRKSNWWHMRQGFVVAITSPKAIAFFAAFFPQFIDPSQPLLPQFILMATSFVILDYSTVVAYAFIAQRAGSSLAKRGAAHWINKISGTTLLVGAALLATINKSAASH
ncbi:LysE family translocator [Maritalea porphyrae]|jgi:homoserine/homoserine lactone efflux protein|uniref:LysE family translocator n=1 Tax=Maritalea porphyrae TaxID=880732 RepID=UPI0022AE572E|nr:LysE family translocator [Maritalea porphyrae]MCZ4272176.1 LysE family translocator [Maritalea porphyrae]